MADQKDFFRQIAVNYRQLAEIAGNPEIKQRMLDMAATQKVSHRVSIASRSSCASQNSASSTWRRRVNDVRLVEEELVGS